MTETYRLTDERLAWLAARDYCTAQAKSHRPGFWVLFVLAVILSVGRAAAIRRRGVAEKLMDYGLAVDELARRLSPAERATLRAGNTLPGWFFPAIDVKFHEVRKRRRDAD